MSHQNVVNAMLGYTSVTTFYENDVYMAYLPLAHVLELISGKVEMFRSFPQ
jgi:long-chain acyl-CoA synthetase